jgi:hypothetical protein
LQAIRGDTMQTRILFNGHEYSGPEQMPADVLKAYQEMLAQLSADTDRNGVPDLLEGRSNVLGVQQSSITVNGRNITDLPKPVKWLLGYAARQAALNTIVPTRTPEQTRRLQTLDATTKVLRTLLLVLSAFGSVALMVVGIWMIAHMDASSRSQGGAFYVGIVVVIAFAWLVGTLMHLARPRE